MEISSKLRVLGCLCVAFGPALAASPNASSSNPSAKVGTSSNSKTSGYDLQNSGFGLPTVSLSPSVTFFGDNSWNVVDPNSFSPTGNEPTQPTGDPFGFQDLDSGGATGSSGSSF